MRVLVAGDGRCRGKQYTIALSFGLEGLDQPVFEIVHAKASGVSGLVRAYLRANPRVLERVVPIDHALGEDAELAWNRSVFDVGIDLLVVFSGGAYTQDLIGVAKSHDIPVKKLGFDPA